MENKKTVAAPERVIAAVLFLLVAVSMVVISALAGGISFWTVLDALAFLAVAIALFSRDRGQFATIAFAFLALVALILFFRGFFVHAYSTASYHYSRYDGGSYEYHFNFLSFLAAVVRLCSYLALAFLAYTNFLKNDPSYNCFWYLPALLLAASFVLSLLASLSGGLLGALLAGSISALITPVLITPLLFSALWITGQEPEGYYSVGRHLAMTIFTFGLWYIAWVWHTTCHLNTVKNSEHRRPTASTLLCLFLPYYAAYWNYASAQRVDRLAKQTGVESKLDVLSFVLSLLVPFLPSIVIQDKLNRITLVRNGAFQPDFAADGEPVPAAPAASAAPAAAPAVPVYDEDMPEL